MSDIQHTKFSNLTKAATQNEFVQISNSYVYVYLHKEYMQANDVTFTNIQRACKKNIIETRKYVYHCQEGENSEGHDDDLLPFFYSNTELAEHYRMIISSTSDVQRRTKIQKYLDCVTYVESYGECRDDDDERFCSDHNMYYYIEDTWTKRLFRAVAFRYHVFYSVEYTAHLRGRTCNSVVLQRMPKGTPLGSLLFHGSPDILMKHRPIGIEHEDKGTGCIEIKKKESEDYTATSMIPQQAGQLICYIHQMLIAYILNCWM